MKEEKKKPTAKKTSTKKTSAAAKKTTTKVAVAKKTVSKAPSKVAVKKPAAKTTATKVAVAKKTVKKTETKVAVKKPTVKKNTTKVAVAKSVAPKASVKTVEKVNVENKVANEVRIEENKENLNKNLIMRTILLVSYTLIIVFLVIGFVDSLTKNTINGPKKAISSYVKTGNVLDKGNIIDLEDASFKLSAINGDYFIYISYTDKDVNAFERDLIKLFSNKKLKSKLYYVNVDEIIGEENSISLINKYLSFKDVLVSKVPTIVYVNKENIMRTENVVSGNGNRLITINDVESLLDRNGF